MLAAERNSFAPLESCSSSEQNTVLAGSRTAPCISNLILKVSNGL